MGRPDSRQCPRAERRGRDGAVDEMGLACLFLGPRSMPGLDPI